MSLRGCVRAGHERGERSVVLLVRHAGGARVNVPLHLERRVRPSLPIRRRGAGREANVELPFTLARIPSIPAAPGIVRNGERGISKRRAHGERVQLPNLWHGGERRIVERPALAEHRGEHVETLDAQRAKSARRHALEARTLGTEIEYGAIVGVRIAEVVEQWRQLAPVDQMRRGKGLRREWNDASHVSRDAGRGEHAPVGGGELGQIRGDDEHVVVRREVHRIRSKIPVDRREHA